MVHLIIDDVFLEDHIGRHETNLFLELFAGALPITLLNMHPSIAHSLVTFCSYFGYLFILKGIKKNSNNKLNKTENKYCALCE